MATGLVSTNIVWWEVADLWSKLQSMVWENNFVRVFYRSIINVTERSYLFHEHIASFQQKMNKKPTWPKSGYPSQY